LRRMGTNKKPFYRIVVADSRAPRDGRFIEQLGHYDPRIEDGLKLDQEKARKWLSVGAQPTETMVTLLRRAGVLEAPKAHLAPKKKPEPEPKDEAPTKAEEPKEEKPAAKEQVEAKAAEEKPKEAEKAKEPAEKKAATKAKPPAKDKAKGAERKGKETKK
jgi:small subunit ribosomal protein S16